MFKTKQAMIKISNTMISISSINNHLESNMLDDEDKADHEAADAAHPGHESEEGVDVHAAW